MKYKNAMESRVSSPGPHPSCGPNDHDGSAIRRDRSADAAVERASRIFRALGDGPRLRLLQLLADGERCVTEVVVAAGEKFSTFSQRLRLLRTEGLVTRRRQGTHLFYALADRHVADLIENALAHASELESFPTRARRRKGHPVEEGEVKMATTSHGAHAGHDHKHGAGCGHT